MTRPMNPLTDDQLVRFLRARAADPDVSVLDAIMRHVETTPQQQPWIRWGPRAPGRGPSMSRAVAIGIAAVVVLAAAAGLGLLTRPNVGAPEPEPSARSSPASWSGPVRIGSSIHPMLSDDGGTRWSWSDAVDATPPWIDIAQVRWLQVGQDNWNIVLSAKPPIASRLDPEQTLISYGLAFETTGDEVPDYIVGISNHAAYSREFRVWVTDLATGETEEQIGGPYGIPVDFSHPDEMADPIFSPEERRTLQLFFLGAPPWGTDSEARMYAWASLTEAGEVVAWDYAPDDGWLEAPADADE
jgi:hypothetical protein